jgi:hypothetical protein
MGRYHLGSWGIGIGVGLLLGVLLGLLVLDNVMIGAGMGVVLGAGFAAAGLAIQDGRRTTSG